VGLFKIVGEESVSAGTRRITALTGKAALDHVRLEEELLAEVSSILKVSPGLVGERISALLEELKALKKQATQRRTEAAPRASADELLASASKLGEVAVVTQAVAGATPDELRQMIDVLRRRKGTGLAVLLVTVVDGKVNLAAGLTPDLVARGLHAGQWLKEVAPVVGGGGGGRPDLAQAGGKDPAKVPDALEKALETVKAKLTE
jgi:alanyl-tRNA synthetase